MRDLDVSGRTSFELTEMHLALLRCLNIIWVPLNFEVPGIDTVAPYGGLDPYLDMAEILGIPLLEEPASEQYDLMQRLHHEMVFALQVVLQTGKMEPGIYQRRGSPKNWELAQRKMRDVKADTFTALVAITPFELFIEVVPLKDVPREERALWNAARAWHYSFSLENRSMIGYWFGGTLASTPALMDVLSGLFRWYGEEQYSENDPVDVRYHNDLIHVLGLDLYNRFYDVTWDFDES